MGEVSEDVFYDDQLWEFDVALGTLRTKLANKDGEKLCLAFWGCCTDLGEVESNATFCKHRDRHNMPEQEDVNKVKRQKKVLAIFLKMIEACRAGFWRRVQMQKSKYAL